jgi:HEAT repeat protein
LFALDDDDPKVRQIAIRSLWDYDNRTAMKRFMYMLENDPDTQVKAAACISFRKIYLPG